MAQRAAIKKHPRYTGGVKSVRQVLSVYYFKGGTIEIKQFVLILASFSGRKKSRRTRKVGMLIL
jgi:hypothetical protein